MPDIDSFLQELSSSAPVPGGGSVAALSTSMAAALLVMVSNLTLGRKRYEHVREEVQSVRDLAQSLRDRARMLAEDDERAYQSVAAAMSLPRQTDQEKQLRTQHVQEALKGAVGPPRETMDTASEVVALAARLAEIGNRSAISDVGSAAEVAAAGFHSAYLNVEINLASITDGSWVERTRAEVRAIVDPLEANAAIQRRVLDVIRGSA